MCWHLTAINAKEWTPVIKPNKQSTRVFRRRSVGWRAVKIALLKFWPSSCLVFRTFRLFLCWAKPWDRNRRWRGVARHSLTLWRTFVDCSSLRRTCSRRSRRRGTWLCRLRRRVAPCVRGRGSDYENPRRWGGISREISSLCWWCCCCSWQHCCWIGYYGCWKKREVIYSQTINT